MTYFTEKTLNEAKLQLGQAALRVWRRLPTDVAGEVLRNAEQMDAAEVHGAELIRDRLHRALNSHSPDAADVQTLAEAILLSWHRIAGMAAGGLIARAWQDLAHLKDQDETGALLEFDFLIEEHARNQVDAAAIAQRRFEAKAGEAEQRKAELERNRTRNHLKSEKSRFSLSSHS